jgi:hypothetical protein
LPPHNAPYPPDEFGGDDRPSVYMEGDIAIYRASAFGSCIKELVALRTAHLSGFVPEPFPQRFKKIFADGHRGEQVIIDDLTAAGWTITRQQEEINWEILPGVIIRGHIDGVAEDPVGEAHIFDAKTTSAKYGIAKDLQARYDLQLSIYGHALGLDSAVLGVGTKDPETGDVVKVDVHGPTPLAVSIAAIRAKAAKIESLARHYEETGDYPTCDEKQYPCSAYRLHVGQPDTADSDDPYGGYGAPYTPILEDNSLDAHAAAYIEAARIEAEAKKKKAAAREAILLHVGGENETRTGLHEIKFTGTGTKKELDKASLSKYLRGQGRDIEEFYGTKGVAKSISVSALHEE